MNEGKGQPFVKRTLDIDKIIEAVEQQEILQEEPDPYPYPRIKKELIPAVLYFTPHNEIKSRLYINPRMEVLLDFPPAEWTDPGFWLRQLHPEDRERVLVEIHKCLCNKNPFCLEYRLVGSANQVAWVHDEGTVVCEGKSHYVQGIMVDITGKRNEERKLRGNIAKFRTVFERIFVGVAFGDLEGRFVETNRALQEVLGYGAQELHLRRVIDLTYPEDILLDIDLYKELVDGRRDHYEMDKRYIRKGGKLVWCHQDVSLGRNNEGEPDFVMYMIKET